MIALGSYCLTIGGPEYSLGRQVVIIRQAQGQPMYYCVGRCCGGWFAERHLLPMHPYPEAVVRLHKARGGEV